ncbi:hypothetical protein Tco_0417870 [Tanacetum coccineum]
MATYFASYESLDLPVPSSSPVGEEKRSGLERNSVLFLPVNFAWFRFSTGVVIGGGALNFSLSKEKISLGVFDFVMETFDEFRDCNSMHESGDSHAFWIPLDIPAFQFIPFHKVFRRLSLPLFDVMDFYGIFNAFLLLEIIFQKCFLQIIVTIY